ncbi:MAG TPA: branched-chain amino acid ABC transporter permease [Myxococcaceae bacterium]|nr:branched-chain amino acid ABC transporter permease [Myxococcaceae bacterium]
MQKFVVVALNSLLAAGLYATMSYGLAVIYGVMRIINLAHAGLMMLAAYATYTLNDRFGLDPFLSLLVVAPAFFLLGLALYALFVRWLPRSSAGPSLQSLLLLFGVWLVLQNLAYAIWGGDTQSILTPYTMESVELLGGRFGVPQILVFVVSILSLVGLNLVLRRTYLGKAIRAVTQNRDAAMLSGVNAGQIAAVAFGIGTAFAAMGGSMLSTLYAFTPDFGRSFLLKSFCIIVLGGMESFTGVALGALVLAFIENFASAYTSIPVSYQDAISFTLLVVVLVAAPGGLPGLWRMLDRRVVAR